jgi:hypothetical protein
VSIRTLNHPERLIIERLVSSGLSQSEATLAVIMTTRGHARPKSDLIEILAQYPSLDSKLNRHRALESLLDLGWIIETADSSSGYSLAHQHPELRTLIAGRLHDNDVATALRSIRANTEPYVEVVGPMNDELVYHSFLERLRQAQEEIHLPMMATAPYPDVVEILLERAKAGIEIRILLAAPELVQHIRGGPVAVEAKKRIAEWARNFANLKNVEVRVYKNIDTIRLTSCLLIDRDLCRIDIHDPLCQRSLEGVMIESVCPPGLSLNLISILQETFDRAWEMAIPIAAWRRVSQIIRFNWLIVTAITTAAIGFALRSSGTAMAYFFGISSSLAATALIGYRRGFARSLNVLASKISGEAE